MKLCEYHQRVILLPLDSEVSLPVPKSECEECISRRQIKAAQAAENEENVRRFFAMIAEIDRPKEWKEALFNKLNPQS